MKVVCLKCGKSNGPNIPVGCDYAGWICPKCYETLQRKIAKEPQAPESEQK